MLVQEIASLITIRNFLLSSIDNLNIRLSRDELKSIQTRVTLLDKTIVEQSLKMDLSKIGTQTMLHPVVREWKSTEDVETIAEKIRETEMCAQPLCETEMQTQSVTVPNGPTSNEIEKSTI